MNARGRGQTAARRLQFSATARLDPDAMLGTRSGFRTILYTINYHGKFRRPGVSPHACPGRRACVRTRFVRFAAHWLVKLHSYAGS